MPVCICGSGKGAKQVEEIRGNRELRDGKGRVGISWDTGCRNLPWILGDYVGTNLLISQVEKLRPREGGTSPGSKAHGSLPIEGGDE